MQSCDYHKNNIISKIFDIWRTLCFLVFSIRPQGTEKGVRGGGQKSSKIEIDRKSVCACNRRHFLNLFGTFRFWGSFSEFPFPNHFIFSPKS